MKVYTIQKIYTIIHSISNIGNTEIQIGKRCVFSFPDILRARATLGYREKKNVPR